MKKTFWGLNLSSCLQYRRRGLVPGPEMETNPVWNGPRGQSIGPVQKENLSHAEKDLMSSESGGEKPDMSLTQVAADSTSIYCPLIILVPWWGINNLNNGVRTTAAALINNATGYRLNGDSTGYKPKVSSQRDPTQWVGEVKRPVNNTNNTLSAGIRGPLLFLLSFPPSCSASLQLSQKYLVVVHFPARWNIKSSLLFVNSLSTPSPNPHLKWLSIERKASRRSQAGLFELTPTQQPGASAARGLCSVIQIWSCKHTNGVEPVRKLHHIRRGHFPCDLWQVSFTLIHWVSQHLIFSQCAL